jgi:hypothetical protein
MQAADSTSTSQVLWVLAAGAAVMLTIVILWVARKGRLQPGPHVFRASRLSRGNHLFPAQVAITATSLTLFRPQWIGKFEESIHMAHIASIKIDTHVLFADVTVETSGGQDPVICHGHLKGDAVEMKRVIEACQSALYSGKSPALPQKDPGVKA